MGIRLNSKEQEELVLKNQKLVFHIAKKFFSSTTNFDDIISVGKIGLLKAAATFEKSKGRAFSTYAGRCIQNEILMYFRKEKLHSNDISLDETINEDNEGNELTLGDLIPSSSTEFTEEIAERDYIIKLISIVLNFLGRREKLIMLYKIAGMTQQSIARTLNLSRSYISRLEMKSIIELESHFNTFQQFKEVFKISIVDTSYIISFSSKDIEQFNRIFAIFLKNLTSAETLPDFKVVSNKERIIIYVPAHHESFYLIAQIIKEIDDYTLTFASNKNELTSKDKANRYTVKKD